jgi:hypothetical protein
MAKQCKAAKQVQVIARYQLKRNGHVVYLLRSSNGVDTYTTTLINGRASGCSCPATKPCYHMRQLETREAERQRDAVAQAAAQTTADERRREYMPLNGNRPFSLMR